MDKLIEALVSKLTEEEGWQGNLNDTERSAALSWAAIRLRQAIQNAFTQTHAQLRMLGQVMGPSPCFVDRKDVLKALLE